MEWNPLFFLILYGFHTSFAVPGNIRRLTQFPQRDLPYVAAAASSSQPASLFVPEAPSLNRFGVSGFRRF